jgi:HNH endonuclease
MEEAMSMRSKKEDPEFEALLLKHASLEGDTGSIIFDNLYASAYINICFKGGIISISWSHVVWFLKYKRWPKKELIVDHLDNDPMNNRPDNLREITHSENQRKRRNRKVYRSYGKGKYGYGISVTMDKRDGRYYVARNLSRGHHGEALKTVKKSLGGFSTLEEAEAKVESYIKELED